MSQRIENRASSNSGFVTYRNYQHTHSVNKYSQSLIIKENNFESVSIQNSNKISEDMKKTNVGPLASKKMKSMTDLFKAATDSSKAASSKFKGYAHGCDVRAIINTMKSDQREHTYCDMIESYAKYRRVVAEWMIDVCNYFNMHPTTTHAAICYLDRLQPNEKFARFEWQMLAIACILISAKYNECEDDVPELATMEEITQQPISSEELLNFELLALKRMGWKLNARSPVAFITSFCFAGVLHTFDSWDEVLTTSDMQANIYSEAVALSTVCLLDESFKGHQASDIASAIIYWVRCKLGVCPSWRKELTDASLCNPYTPGAIAVFNQLKQLFPQERITLVMPNAVGSPMRASPILRSQSTSAIVSSPVALRDENAENMLTPTISRANSLEETVLQTPVDQIIPNQIGPKIVGGKVVIPSTMAPSNEPSPISIAFDD